MTSNRDSLAAQLRSGENPRLPVLSAAGKRQADSCATLLLNGCALPLWAIASDDLSFPSWGAACGQWGV